MEDGDFSYAGIIGDLFNFLVEKNQKQGSK